MTSSRPLRPKERDLLETVLPGDRPGYRFYRDLLTTLCVIGDGRRGEGDVVLGPDGETPDLASPLTPVVAYGVVETTRDQYTVTVREFAGGQLDVEIVSRHGDPIPDHYEEKRRWTYSSWSPGSPSPATGTAVREIDVDGLRVLVIAPSDKRIWVHDRESGMNLLIPITNFYNEIMLHKHIRDPRLALDSGKFFEQHAGYSDDDLRAAFVAYNALRHRVAVRPPPPAPPPAGFWRRLRMIATKGSTHG